MGVSARSILKTVFGTLSIFMGTIILAWFVYNQFAPTDAFKRNYHGIFQLACPVMMIYVGWCWIRNRPVG